MIRLNCTHWALMYDIDWLNEKFYKRTPCFYDRGSLEGLNWKSISRQWAYGSDKLKLSMTELHSWIGLILKLFLIARLFLNTRFEKLGKKSFRSLNFHRKFKIFENSLYIQLQTMRRSFQPSKFFKTFSRNTHNMNFLIIFAQSLDY